MDVLLITSPTRLRAPNQEVPVGVLALDAWLWRHGDGVKVIDAAHTRPSHQEICRAVRDYNPAVIGLSGIITAYRYLMELSRRLKREFPETPIVLGGQVTINNDANCFQHMGVDYVVHGYGEIPFSKLLDSLQGRHDIEDIPGLGYLRGNRLLHNPAREFTADLDELPLPAYDLVDMEHYAAVYKKFPELNRYLARTGKKIESYRHLRINGALGCSGRCTFCIHEQEYKGVRLFSLDYMRRHIRLLHDEYGIRILSIGEEMFITSLKRLRAFNEMMNREFPDMFWRTGSRASYITPEIIAELERGACFCVGFGFESGSQTILDIMQKGVKIEQSVRVIRALNKSPIENTYTTMAGSVGETNRTIRETISVIKRTPIAAQPGNVFFTTPYPGGRIWDWALDRGIIKDAHQYLLDVSNVDAKNFSINLTPYPDWVVKSWNELLRAARERELHKSQAGRGEGASWRRRIAKARQGTPVMNPKIPLWLLRLGVEVYGAYYRLSRLFCKTRKDKMYAFERDERGVLSAPAPSQPAEIPGKWVPE
jgi:radical SAM superfamily enzyme YgiQ (UPF0313 family)